MNEIEDFIEDPNENSDLFDCEFTSVDAVVNQIMVFRALAKELDAAEQSNRKWRPYTCGLWGGLQSVCFLH